MITKVRLLSGNGLDRDYAIGHPEDVLEFTGSISFRELKCPKCDGPPDRRRLVVYDWRPTAAADENLPTLVGIYGWESPRGAFSWKVPENIPHIVVPHYYRKDDAWIFFLLAPGGRVRKENVRRYFDTDLWFSYNGAEGRVFSQGDDMASILWVEGELLSFEPPEVEERPHYRCSKIAPDLERGGFLIQRLEGRTRFFRNGEEIVYIRPGDIPVGVCRYLGIQFCDHYDGEQRFLPDPYVCTVGYTPVFWDREKNCLYGGKYTLYEGEKVKLNLSWQQESVLNALRWRFHDPSPRTLKVVKEKTDDGTFYTVVITEEADDND